jgi:hypothetical protein
MQQYEFNGFRLDAGRRLLFGPDGQRIALKPKVFDTLVQLAGSVSRFGCCRIRRIRLRRPSRGSPQADLLF